MGDPVEMGWLDRIVNVHFGDDELVFFRYNYNVGFLKQPVPPVALDCTVNINDTGVTRSILGNLLDGKKTVAVTQPNVTGDMINNLYSWTPKPAFTQTSIHTVPAHTIYYVDNGTVIVTKDNFEQTFPLGTNLKGQKVSYIDAAGHVFWEGNSTLQGFLHGALGNNYKPAIFEAGPEYDNISDAQYVADGFNLFLAQGIPIPKFFVSTLTVADAQGAAERAGGAIFILNAGLIKAKLPVGRKSTTVRFQVNSGASDTIGWGLNAGVYTTRKSFPVDKFLSPTFPDFPQAGFAGSKGAVSFTATVTFGKNPTVSFS